METTDYFDRHQKSYEKLNNIFSEILKLIKPIGGFSKNVTYSAGVNTLTMTLNFVFNEESLLEYNFQSQKQENGID